MEPRPHESGYRSIGLDGPTRLESLCVCVCFCLCVCLHVRERDRQREKKAEKRSFAYVARGGYPFSDGSSQVQDVLSQIVRKHIWQGLVATLL